jgi:predicted XRE-type DNA-binding protein
MNTKQSRRAFFEARGLKVYETPWEALGFSPEEAEVEEMKYQLARSVKTKREEAGITQGQLAKKLHTSQPRVAAMERMQNTTLDALFRALAAMGLTRKDFGQIVAA